MRDLGSSDLQTVMNIGYSVAECHDQNTLRCEAVQLIQSALSADSSVYMKINENPKGSLFQGSVAHGHPESEMTKWCNRYQPIDPFVDRFLRHYQNPCERVIPSHKVVKEREFLNSRFYQEFLAPMSIYHVLLMGLTAGDRPLGVVGFHRPRNAPAFSEREIAMAEIIAPYFASATLRTLNLEQLSEREQILNYLSARSFNQCLLVLDEALRPIFASDALADLLQPETAIRPAYLCPRENLIIPRAILQQCVHMKNPDGACKQDGAVAKIKLQLPGDAHPVGVTIRAVNWNGGALRFVISFQKEAQPEMQYELLTRHGLTARQADIAQLVSVGLTNAEIAEKLCISTRTVENHLRTIYEKAGVNNRTSLIYRLALET